MTESEFNEQIDDLLMSLEDQIDESDTDIDYETTAGILTITLENNSQIIINRQLSHFQLWLAAKSGGYHFEKNPASEWIDTRSGNSFFQTLNKCMSEQSNNTIIFE